MSDRNPLGPRIREFRLQRDMSQEDLAIRMQNLGHATLTQQRINEIENGRRRVTAQEAVSFAAALGVPVALLLGVPSDRPPSLD